MLPLACLRHPGGFLLALGFLLVELALGATTIDCSQCRGKGSVSLSLTAGPSCDETGTKQCYAVRVYTYWCSKCHTRQNFQPVIATCGRRHQAGLCNATFCSRDAGAAAIAAPPALCHSRVQGGVCKTPNHVFGRQCNRCMGIIEISLDRSHCPNHLAHLLHSSEDHVGAWGAPSCPTQPVSIIPDDNLKIYTIPAP